MYFLIAIVELNYQVLLIRKIVSEIIGLFEVETFITY